MDALHPTTLSPGELRSLRGKLATGPEILSFKEEPELTALVASLGICREVGTINDEMARFVFDGKTGRRVPRHSLKAELVRYHGAVGVRIWAEGHSQLDIRFRGLRSLLHPRFSTNDDGSIRQCVFFPESIARILALDEAELVLVRPWGLNTIFGGFDPSKHYYQTNLWELENNDTVLFSRMLKEKKIPFLGTHDLVAHIAGVKASAWPNLIAKAAQVHDALEHYFAAIEVPTIASLVLPYTVGVLLDDLAQPPNYDAPGRHVVIDDCLRAIQGRTIRPEEPRLLLKFPRNYESVINLGRGTDMDRIRKQSETMVRGLTQELLQHSVHIPKKAG